MLGAGVTAILLAGMLHAPVHPEVRQEPKPAPVIRHAQRGTATWYCGAICTRGYPSGLYAAAGSELRVGDWRGRRVRVTAAGRSVVVTLVDTCQCSGRRIIDLYSDVWARLGVPLSRGVVRVTVSW
jgi:rare lipoprotein A (peptidoglycan hydrolase)